MRLLKKLKRPLRVLIERADGLGKLGGGAIIILAILTAIPIVNGYVKGVMGYLYGVTGAVYYEVGPGGNAMFEIEDEVDGGLFLLRGGGRRFGDLKFGDILQAGTDKNFRLIDGPKHSIPDNPKIFVLRAGECVVVLRRELELTDIQAASGGWARVATTSCGLFR